jgi:hypothetical protein
MAPLLPSRLSSKGWRYSRRLWWKRLPHGRPGQLLGRFVENNGIIEVVSFKSELVGR